MNESDGWHTVTNTGGVFKAMESLNTPIFSKPLGLAFLPIEPVYESWLAERELDMAEVVCQSNNVVYQAQVDLCYRSTLWRIKARRASFPKGITFLRNNAFYSTLNP